LRNLSFHVIGTIVLSMLVVCIALGGGYQINEQGARAVGMGGAFVARASDPSAVYFNPAGLAFQNGINVLGGSNIILPSTKFTGSGIQLPVETSTNSQVFTPVNLYGSYQISDDIVVGVGVYNPYGLGTQWPDKWGQTIPQAGGLYMGGYNSVNASIVTWYINPTIAYKVNNQLSVGLGISYVTGSVAMSRVIPAKAVNAAFSGYFKNELNGTGNDINFNLGAIYKPMDNLSIGIAYRATTKIEFSGDLKFSNSDVPAPMYPTIATLFPGGTGKATLPMPGSLTVGVAYKVLPELTVEGDFQYVQWTTYDQLQIQITPVTPAQTSSTSLKNWNDGYIFRGGAEYTMDQDFTLRGGLILDLTPQPASKAEPMLPDGDRVDVTLGGSYKLSNNLSVDLSYMLVLFMETDATSSALPGKYKSNAHIISLDFGYSF
jgi:long-chain fatty acid transport protein